MSSHLTMWGLQTSALVFPVYRAYITETYNNILVERSLLFLAAPAVLFPVISVRPRQVVGTSRNRKWKWVIKADPGLRAQFIQPRYE